MCTVNDPCDDGWNKAAVTDDKEGNIYILSSKDSKCTLRVFDKKGELVQTILSDMPEKSPNQQPSSGGNQEVGHPLSIAVASNGTIAAAIGGPEVVMITVEEVDAQ